MKTIYILDSKTIELKYIRNWQNNLRDCLEEYIQKKSLKYQVKTLYDIQPNTLSIIDNSPLTFKDIVNQQASQSTRFAELFYNKEVHQGDHFIFMDAWNPAIFQLRYLSTVYRTPVWIHGFWQTGSFNKTSYLSFAKTLTWQKNAERALVAAINHNYYDSDYHLSLLKSLFKTFGAKHLFNTPGRVQKAGPPMAHVREYAEQFKKTKKRDMILFADKGTVDRNMIIFRELQRAMPQYEWVCIEDKMPNETQYHGLLASSKYVLILDLIDSSSITAFEAIMHGSIPLAPDRLNFKEIVPEKWRYPSHWTLSYLNYTENYTTIIDYIKDRMENYDIYKEGIEEWAKHLDTNYYRIEALKDNVFYLEQ
jgi:hypothetical protein